ncbi:hypothetical protein ACFPJ1_22855 [Kribbella qitaiheensis]|uniref:hypothetical protein n=1 Tax=Kribbella qitaiheensis TaxID=1544730 RepID=UPI00361BE616
MGLDYAFWKSGQGTVREIYEDLGDGISARLEPSSDVLEFREFLLDYWPDLEESIEPFESDPDFDPEDLKKYVVVNIHANDVAKMDRVWQLAEQYQLVAYDPLHTSQ